MRFGGLGLGAGAWNGVPFASAGAIAKYKQESQARVC